MDGAMSSNLPELHGLGCQYGSGRRLNIDTVFQLFLNHILY